MIRFAGHGVGDVMLPCDLNYLSQVWCVCIGLATEHKVDRRQIGQPWRKLMSKNRWWNPEQDF